jgi:hypothetical protein
VLDQDYNLTGHPVVNLHVNSTHSEGAWHVYLEDVDSQQVQRDRGHLTRDYRLGICTQKTVMRPGLPCLTALRSWRFIGTVKTRRGLTFRYSPAATWTGRRRSESLPLTGRRLSVR